MEQNRKKIHHRKISMRHLGLELFPIETDYIQECSNMCFQNYPNFLLADIYKNSGKDSYPGFQDNQRNVYQNGTMNTEKRMYEQY